jgi:hypothetical protein
MSKEISRSSCRKNAMSYGTNGTWVSWRFTRYVKIIKKYQTSWFDIFLLPIFFSSPIKNIIKESII